MPERKVIVCLANSWKHHDRCVAGIELLAEDHVGDWVRPVSARDGHGVSRAERRLEGGAEPAPLDLLEISVQRRQPATFQTENWLVDSDESWTKIGECAWNDLGELADAPPDLWGIGDSSGKGLNDRVAEVTSRRLATSLALIHVEDLTLQVLDGGFREVKREVRAIFKYRRAVYDLKVTDPRYAIDYLDRDDGRYRLGEAYLTISLTEALGNYCYKVVAAILEPDGAPEDPDD